MITSSNYYSIVNKETRIIVAKGSKKALMKLLKANRGVYSLAITSRPVGEKFA